MANELIKAPPRRRGHLPTRPQPSAFATTAMQSFQRTFLTLFQQADVEAARLARINRVIHRLEDSLLDPDNLDELGPQQQVLLLEALERSQRGSTTMLLSISKVMTDVRSIVGTVDSLQRVTDAAGATLEYDADDDDDVWGGDGEEEDAEDEEEYDEEDEEEGEGYDEFDDALGDLDDDPG